MQYELACCRATMLLTIFFSTLIVALIPETAVSDIYRFVTIDGVESFTDTPVSKDSQVIIKDTSRKAKTSKRSNKALHKQQTHDISLEEIVTKAVEATQQDLFPDEHTQQKQFEIKLPPVGGSITSTVGMRIDPIDGKWRMHNGIDIAIPQGTPVRPSAGGIVLYSGLRSGYGYTVLVEHENGVITLYGHNSRLLVSVGQKIEADTVIAYSGNTGRSTGPHLHFEAWQAGSNVTSAFMPGSGEKLPTRLASISPSHQTFRKQILSDGTILFTNLP